MQTNINYLYQFLIYFKVSPCKYLSVNTFFMNWNLELFVIRIWLNKLLRHALIRPLFYERHFKFQKASYFKALSATYLYSHFFQNSLFMPAGEKERFFLMENFFPLTYLLHIFIAANVRATRDWYISLSFHFSVKIFYLNASSCDLNFASCCKLEECKTCSGFLYSVRISNTRNMILWT